MLKKIYLLIFPITFLLFFTFHKPVNAQSTTAPACQGSVWNYNTGLPISGATVDITWNNAGSVGPAQHLILTTDSSGHWETTDASGNTATEWDWDSAAIVPQSILYTASGYTQQIVNNTGLSCTYCASSSCSWSSPYYNIHLQPQGSTPPPMGWNCINPAGITPDQKCGTAAVSGGQYSTQAICVNNCNINLTPAPTATPIPNCTGQNTGLPGVCTLITSCNGVFDGRCGTFQQCCIACGQQGQPCCPPNNTCASNTNLVCSTITNRCIAPTATPTPGGPVTPGQLTPYPGIHQNVLCTSGGTTDDPNASNGEIYTAIGCIPVRGGVQGFVATMLPWAIGIAGGIAVILIIYAGFLYTTSSGNPQKINAAKELLTAALSGLILLIFAAFILRFIGQNLLSVPGF